MTRLAEVPERTHRLIPSRFPPSDAFETVTRPEDLGPVLDLEGCTNDRLVAPRLRRVPKSEWVYGRANASVMNLPHQSCRLEGVSASRCVA